MPGHAEAEARRETLRPEKLRRREEPRPPGRPRQPEAPGLQEKPRRGEEPRPENRGVGGGGRGAEVKEGAEKRGAENK